MRALFFLLLVTSSAHAAELRSVVVEREDGLYSLESEVFFAAETEALYEVFLNYDLTQEFTRFVVESRNLEPDEQLLSPDIEDTGDHQ